LEYEKETQFVGVDFLTLSFRQGYLFKIRVLDFLKTELNIIFTKKLETN